MTPRTVTSPCKVRVEESNQGYLSFLPYDGTVYRVDTWLVVTVFAWLLSRLFFLHVQAVVVGASETLMLELDSYKMLFSRVDGNALAGTLKIEYIKRMVFK